ncbi:hypothetical protein AYO43_09050 [Nitrospira sp. SCGC AG-212-E16]|nr:hypothetical protein AYO43_09050 [Nitrospira sp. SCGC AG-212-E16]
MLKKSASFVLDSSKSSTYPRGYASGFDSPAALLNGLFEHPAGILFYFQNVRTGDIPANTQSFFAVY